MIFGKKRNIQRPSLDGKNQMGSVPWLSEIRKREVYTDDVKDVGIGFRNKRSCLSRFVSLYKSRALFFFFLPVTTHLAVLFRGSASKIELLCITREQSVFGE